MSTVHPTARAGWGGGGAAVYEAGRPGYPPAAVALIASELRLTSGDAVLDLAAGTGKFTRALRAGLDQGTEVIAVEPVAAMRDQLTAAVPGVRVLDGSAEAIPLPDSSVAAVTVAQAFHWFDVPRAATEIARVLAPGGGLAIVRNDWRPRDAGAGWAGAVREYLDGAVALPETHGRDWRSELDATGRFEPFAERELDNAHPVDLEGIVRRMASMSFVAALGDSERAELLHRIRALLREHGLRPGVPVTLPERTVIRWTQARTRPPGQPQTPAPTR